MGSSKVEGEIDIGVVPHRLLEFVWSAIDIAVERLSHLLDTFAMESTRLVVIPKEFELHSRDGCTNEHCLGSEDHACMSSGQTVDDFVERLVLLEDTGEVAFIEVAACVSSGF